LHECEHEKDWGRIESELERFKHHVTESDKEGGYRDRLNKLELCVAGLYFRLIISAFIGGLLGNQCPYLIEAIVKHLFKVGG
jgi:hypothetical protein